MLHKLQLLLNRLKVVDINLWVYVFDEDCLSKPLKVNTKLHIEEHPFEHRADIIQYKAIIDKQVAHTCLFFKKAEIMQLLPNIGGLIGNNHTLHAFRGQGIYPMLINHIAKSKINAKAFKEIYIFVAPDNKASIRGIEKAGFNKRYHMKAKRFLWFYFNRQLVLL